MAWWMAALLWIGTTIAGRLFRHKPKREVPHPGTWDSEQMPMISESSSIPVIWGTVRLEAPNVLWFGAPATWNKYEGPTLIAVRYYLTLQYGLCIGPIDRVEAIEWDGLRPDVAARVDGQFYDQIFYRQMNLFGGDLQAGGIYAEIRAYKGLADQPSDSHLEAKVGATLPGYPHLAYLVVRNNPYPHSEEDPCILVRTLPGWTCPCLDFDLGMCIGDRSAYFGTVAMLHPMAVEVRRVDRCNPLELTADVCQIGDDANPANMLYEILTDEVWGLGIPYAQGIDRDSFVAAATTLAAEAFGLSMKLEDGGPAKELIDEILRHIDGVLVLDPDDGRLQLRLLRGDYDVSELSTFGPDEIQSFNFSRPALETLSNSVRLTYINRSDHYRPSTVMAQDLAAIGQCGDEMLEEVSYPGVSNSTLAQSLAARDLKALSYPWARVSFSVDRSAWNLRQGSPFRLDWPELGITGMVCRVTRIHPGNLIRGQISIEAVEDVFGVSWTAYGPIPPSGWVDPYVPTSGW